jgi:hypothetical protein
MIVGPMLVAGRQLTEQIAVLDKAVRASVKPDPACRPVRQPLWLFTLAPANDVAL